MIASQLLILTHEYPPRRGGIATYVAETAEAARSAGWDVTLLVPRYVAPVEESTLHVVPTSACGTQGWIDRFRLWGAVRRLEMNWKETVIWLPEPAPICLWLHSDLFPLPQPARLILTLHGSEILRFGRARQRRRRFAALLTRTDRVCVVSQAIEDLLRRFFPLGTIEVKQAPGAVSRELEAAIQACPQGGRGDPFRVLTVGRVHPRKGQLAVVEALGQLPPRVKDQIEYAMIGPVRRNRYLSTIQDRAHRLGIQLIGPTEAPDPGALAEAYRRADVMVLASREEALSIEGFGLVYLEAAAAGCPVIATDAGGAREAVGPDNGFVVPANNPAALRDAIAAIVADRALGKRLGAAGPEWARRFSWKRVAQTHFGHD